MLLAVRIAADCSAAAGRIAADPAAGQHSHSAAARIAAACSVADRTDSVDRTAARLVGGGSEADCIDSAVERAVAAGRTAAAAAVAGVAVARIDCRLAALAADRSCPAGGLANRAGPDTADCRRSLAGWQSRRCHRTRSPPARAGFDASSLVAVAVGQASAVAATSAADAVARRPVVVLVAERASVAVASLVVAAIAARSRCSAAAPDTVAPQAVPPAAEADSGAAGTGSESAVGKHCD